MNARTCILTALMILIAVPALSGETGRAAHDKELVFRLNGLDNIDLNVFDGGLGLRWFVSSTVAIRPGFTYSTYEDQNIPNDPYYATQVRDSENYAVDIVVERHLAVSGRTSTYWGGGFSFGRNSHGTRSQYEEDPSPGVTLSDDYRSKFKSILALAGFQWTAGHGISLGCEYQFTYLYNVEDSTRNYFEEPTRISHNVDKRFSASTSSLFLAVEF